MTISPNAWSQFNRFEHRDFDIFDKEILDYLQETKAVGISVGVIHEGKISMVKGYGYQDRENNIKAKEETLYRLASVSKPITGLMSVLMSFNDELDLNKDIRDYVPEYPVKPEGVITAIHLLSNQSGVIHYAGTANGQYCQAPYNIIALNQYSSSHLDYYDPVSAIDIFKDQRICFEPGDHYQYSTWGFCLMGAVIERATEATFEEVLYDKLIEPLCLPFLQPEFIEFRNYPNETQGYEFNNAGDVITTPSHYTDAFDISYKVPGGGLIGSVIDLSLIIEGVVNRILLDDDGINFWSDQRIPNDGENPYYGLGISSGMRNGKRLLHHSGAQAKTSTLIYFSPDNKNGVAIMCNTRGLNLYPLARFIYDRLEAASSSGPLYPHSCPQIFNINKNKNQAAPDIEGNFDTKKNIEEQYAISSPRARTSYIWTVEGGVIVSGQNTALIQVKWSDESVGKICVIEINSEGCESEEGCKEVQLMATSTQGTSKNWLRIYPNPIKESFVIENREQLIIERVEVYDLHGNICHEVVENVSTPKSISMKGLSEGAYMVSVVSGNLRKNVKIIKSD